MNERIKEFAEQAGFSFKYKTVPDELNPGHKLQDLEKFAELIVKECLNQCERIRSDAVTQKKSDFLTESGKTLYEGVYGGATNCGFAIQQYFGIEE